MASQSKKSRTKQPRVAAPASVSAVENLASQTLEASPVSGVESRGVESRPSERYFLGALAILILGIALRQINLGPAPFHPDEAIHAFFSYGFATYKYDPVFHGPLLYHLVGSVFGIFGQHDFTARLVPSLLGVLLIWMILFPARRFLGNRGALASAAIVAVSPAIVTYSRHLLHDALVLVLTFGSVLCLLTCLEKPSNDKAGRAARIGLFAFLSLFLATKANCFFIAVMLLVFWLGWRFAGRLKIPDEAARSVPLLAFGVVTLASIVYPRETTDLPAIQATQHSIFQLIAVGACGWMFLWLLTRQPQKSETEFKAGWRKIEPTTYVLALAAALWIYVFLFGGFMQTAIAWASEKSFPVQTFQDGITGARTAIFRMLEYWGGQQSKPRLAGRHDYYIVLGLLYELPLYGLALGGIWHAAKNRSAFSDLLLWWAFTSWTIYAVANEKVPWLLVHIVLPLALLTGFWLGQVRWNKTVLLVVASLGAFFTLRGDYAFIFQRAGDNAEPMLYAQTPDAFRDAVEDGLNRTKGDKGLLWMENERQWPSVWYFRERNNPLRGDSGTAIAGVPDVKTLRMGVSQEKDVAYFESGGFVQTKVNFLIWPRASWTALQPHRYWGWFWSRDTLPVAERDKPREEWKTSILAGKGEWSSAQAIVGVKR